MPEILKFGCYRECILSYANDGLSGPCSKVPASDKALVSLGQLLQGLLFTRAISKAHADQALQ